MRRKVTKRQVTLTVCFQGDGRVHRSKDGVSFSGGVVAPTVSDNVCFTIHREASAEQPDGEDNFHGSLQVNVYADSAGYRELGRYLLALAERDTTADPDFHEHHDGLLSADGRTRIHLICRKVADVNDYPPRNDEADAV